MKNILTFLILVLILIFSGCSKDDVETKEDNSVETLQKENGVPVRITEITGKGLIQWDEYSGTLSGFEEIPVFGMLGDNYANVNVETGDIVKKGQILAHFSNDFPSANYNQAKIGYETAEKTYNRMKKVFQSGGISQQQLDEVEAQYKIAKENFNATKQLVKVISPASGVVVSVNFDTGSKNDPKRPLCTINKTGKLTTTIFIEEEKIASYKTGDSVRVKWEGLKDSEFAGVINKLSMASNPRMRGFSAEILIDNGDEQLMPGIFVYVYASPYSNPDAVSIPRDAYFSESGKKYVFVSDGITAVKREIETGKRLGSEVEIIKGLQPGDKLISEGRSLLEDGSKIRVID